MSEERRFAVLTGDIIKSSTVPHSELELLRKVVLEAVNEVKGWKRGMVKGQAEFFRGDAWQMLLANPAQALRVAVFVRASLLAKGNVDSRISIGLGRAEKISKSRVSLSTGEAFVLSGHGLDRMTQYSSMTIELPKSTGAIADWLPVVGSLCDSLLRQWTERQAEVVCLAVQPEEPTQGEIAEKLNPPVSRQAVTKALDGANWYSIRSAIRQFESTDWSAVLEDSSGTGLG